ncbi:MAG: hypothetical protein M2R45_04553 [Verrucomicrobia subdivision 3 bacterium]|nr:hypothetical protein [Limisphaerales bacterium]MCS1416808.1 hypothetical protein [Limisphaerales bacterium]
MANSQTRARYEIGSVTKVFTGTLLTHMVGSGDVQHTERITAYLPRRVNVPERQSRATPSKT